MYAQQCNIIYVSPTGASSGSAGTQSNPASLAYGFTLASSTNNQLWLASGNYFISNTLYMISDVTVEGGFDGTTWIKSNLQASVIYRDNSNIQTAPNRLVAIECVGISNFRLQDLTINVSNAVGNGITVYGIHLDACSNYSITRCDVTTGNATDGQVGNPGANGVNGANGANGQQGDGDGSCCTAGGAGGSGSYTGSNAGGNGGDGGARGSSASCFFCLGGSAPDGSAGTDGTGPAPGIGGAGGVGACLEICISTGCDAGPANNGVDGTDGGAGAPGIDGIAGIPAFGNYFINGDGLVGQNGDHGSGGGGGGGGGSQGCIAGCFGNFSGAGAGGGGGGEGGQGGTGATGGSGGGGSFAVYIFGNNTGTEVKDCKLNSGLQGYGGLGGAPGGPAGLGGVGGFGISSDCDLGDPGDGGMGGDGGAGGNGGNGAPGVSIPLYEDPFGTAAAQSDMRSTVEPEIYVKSTGCTYSDIEFSTNATGIIIWYFDGGAVPLSVAGDSAVIQYTSMGRHTITLVVDGVPYIFTDFVGIFSDGSVFLPTILSPDSISCPGVSNSFSSSFTGAIYYDWIIYDSVTVNIVGTGVTSINYTFNNTGTYDITLQTTSICCGRSTIDTFQVDIVPYMDPLVYISVTSASICEGDATTFGAVPVNGGAAPGYQWMVNNVAIGNTSNVFTTSTLSDGDVIACVMISDYPCPTTPTDTSDAITITVSPLPDVVCSATRLYLGADTEFLAFDSVGTAPYTYSWDFGDGGVDTGAAPLHYYGSTGTYTISVTVTDANGCTNTCTEVITIIVAPFVDAQFTSNNNVLACDSVSVQFTDQSIGNPDTWYWDFGDGDTSTLQNPTHTFIGAGSYNVTLAATNGVYTDSTTYPNYVLVVETPTADIRAFDTSGCTSVNTQFLDQSIGADTWIWSFGDGDSAFVPNAGHSYASTGSYNITLIVGANGICFDTAYTTLNVYDTPVANFTRDSACATYPITFIDSSSINPPDVISTWDWDFGDGSENGTDTIETHAYSTGGTYVTTLTVTSNYGCRDTATNTILVYSTPVADFVFEPDTATLLLPLETFYDTSTGSGLLFWLWHFGDGDSSSIQDPVHLYKDTGVFIVRLVVADSNSCSDTIYKKIYIKPDYIFFMPNTFTPNGDGINEDVKPQGIGISEDSYRYYIFNRWGDQIWETNDPNVAWDGTGNKGKQQAQSEIYIWMVITRDLSGIVHNYTGHITMIR